MRSRSTMTAFKVVASIRFWCAEQRDAAAALCKNRHVYKLNCSAVGADAQQINSHSIQGSCIDSILVRGTARRGCSALKKQHVHKLNCSAVGADAQQIKVTRHRACPAKAKSSAELQAVKQGAGWAAHHSARGDYKDGSSTDRRDECLGSALKE